MRARVLLPELLHLVLLAVLVQEVRRPVRADDAHVRAAAGAQVVEDTRVDGVCRQLDRLRFLRLSPEPRNHLHIRLISVLQHGHGRVGAGAQRVVGETVHATLTATHRPYLPSGQMP